MFGNYTVFFYIFCLFLNINASFADVPKPLVLVSIAPYRAFVKAIAEETVDIQVIVPPGASSHTFEPSPKETVAATKADVWFTIGEMFEKKFHNVIQNHFKKITISDLRKGVDSISVDPDKAHCNCSHSHLIDLHIWLSPKEAKVQVKTIADTLSQLYPDHTAIYQKNLEHLLTKLSDLDKKIKNIFKNKKPTTLLVSHPAYAYFCRDYGLTQLSVEFEGKDPTAKQLTNLLKKAEEEKIKVIFTQPQYNNKGSYLIAKQIGATIVSIDPYSENYFDTLLLIAQKLTSNQ